MHSYKQQYGPRKKIINRTERITKKKKQREKTQKKTLRNYKFKNINIEKKWRIVCVIKHRKNQGSANASARKYAMGTPEGHHTF